MQTRQVACPPQCSREFVFHSRYECYFLVFVHASCSPSDHPYSPPNRFPGDGLPFVQCRHASGEGRVTGQTELTITYHPSTIPVSFGSPVHRHHLRRDCLSSSPTRPLPNRKQQKTTKINTTAITNSPLQAVVSTIILYHLRMNSSQNNFGISCMQGSSTFSHFSTHQQQSMFDEAHDDRLLRR